MLIEDIIVKCIHLYRDGDSRKIPLRHHNTEVLIVLNACASFEVFSLYRDLLSHPLKTISVMLSAI